MTTTTITTTDLADEMAERHDITRQAARDAVDTYVGQIVSLDGEDATIASTEDLRNGSGRVIGHTVTLTAETADFVRGCFAADYKG